MRPSLTNTLANLQFVEIEMSRSDARELGLLDCLLQIAPALKLKFQPARHPKRYKSFSENSESLKKRLEQGMITEKICEIGFLF
jgi:hypothetical protein